MFSDYAGSKGQRGRGWSWKAMLIVAVSKASWVTGCRSLWGPEQDPAACIRRLPPIHKFKCQESCSGEKEQEALPCTIDFEIQKKPPRQPRRLETLNDWWSWFLCPFYAHWKGTPISKCAEAILYHVGVGQRLNLNWLAASARNFCQKLEQAAGNDLSESSLSSEECDTSCLQALSATLGSM